MAYDFKAPAGWSRLPFPPPGRGVYLRTATEGPRADPASILLFDAVIPSGSLEEQLAGIVAQGCHGAGVKIVKQAKPVAVRSAAYPGAQVTVTVKVDAAGKSREETRVFTLLDAGAQRLPIAFLAAGSAHQAAHDALVASVAPVDGAPYAMWVE